MSNIDCQRISAVKLLEGLGYVFRASEWHGPPAGLDVTPEADLMHGMLITRADALEGFSANSPEEAEYAAIAELVETYEAKRWPDGRSGAAKASCSCRRPRPACPWQGRRRCRAPAP